VPRGAAMRVLSAHFSAFGTVLDQSDPSEGHRMMGFAGMELDSVTGMNLAVYRVQDPGTGRWTGQDPLGFAAGGPNLYGYVGNGAPNSCDPLGLFGEPEGDVYTLGIYTNVNSKDNQGWADGHAFISITVNGRTTTYGLWPDWNPDVIGNGPLGTDVRVDFPYDNLGQYRYSRFYRLTPKHFQRFQRYVKRKSFWTGSHTCASFARDVVEYTTGEHLRAHDLGHLGVDTPVQLGTGIGGGEGERPTSPTNPLPPRPYPVGGGGLPPGPGGMLPPVVSPILKKRDIALCLGETKGAIELCLHVKALCPPFTMHAF
jgi:RHS repeat-associated protein